MNESKRIWIFDTTLRDGQQCPGAGMNFKKNLEYAALACELNVDVLEAGFPAASRLDFEIVHEIASSHARSPQGTIIAALCQLRDEQIDRTIESLLPAVQFKRARLHTYVPVDPELMKASLGEKANQKSQIVKNVYDFVKRGVDAGLEVEFSPEGYSRMGENFNFTADLIRAAIEAGCLVVNCPDTIGGACELEGEEYFVSKMNRHAAIMAKEFPGRTVIWSVHCHNDFGLAVPNSINGVFKGPARQIEGCITGIGERAGNAALEQVVMILKHFAHFEDSRDAYYTNVKTEHLQKICDFVSTNMLPRQPHWPIAGDNAARHSSGGHTNAVLKNPLAYQPFDPKEVGKEISLLFGPLSGSNHAQSIIRKFGFRCDENEKTEIAQYLKDHYKDRRKGVTDEELIKGYFVYRSPIKVEEFDYSRTSNQSSVRIAGEFFGEKGIFEETHTGKDSALAALKQAIDKRFPGFDIQIHKSMSDREGIDAQSVSTIVLVDKKNNVFEGIGEDFDIEISAMKALIAATNNAYVSMNYKEGAKE